MGSLFGSLNVALQSLLANQAALEITSNNVANANTPGFSRQRPVLTEQPPVQIGSLLFGTGVSLSQVQSVRDQVLELRIQQETQHSGQLDSQVSGLDQIQALFNETQGVGLQSALSKFFNSLQSLSTDPTNLTLRQNVLNAGQQLADAFHQASTGLTRIKSGIDQTVPQTVSQVNQLASEIADLNAKIASSQGSGQEPGAFVDQRNEAIRQLSNLVNVSVIDAKDGTVTLTTGNGSALVVGNQTFGLQTQVIGGVQHVLDAQGTDITTGITGGTLGGTIQVRDQSVPSFLSSLDQLASSLTTAFNTQHAAGFDLNGAAGGNFFNPTTTAANFGVAITDPKKVAASSDGTAGNNGNALALAALQNQNIVGGQTVTAFYANLISTIGSQASDAKNQQQAEDSVLQQLTNQRNAVSRVSLDEEAANLVQYQRAYDAAARVFSVINDLTDVTINLGK